jgi:hypothetical protein
LGVASSTPNGPWGWIGHPQWPNPFFEKKFPDIARSVISFRVDYDILSLDGKEPLETQAEVAEDGKLHVTVRKSTSSQFEIFS